MIPGPVVDPSEASPQTDRLLPTVTNQLALASTRRLAIAPAALASLLVHGAIAVVLGVVVSTRPATWGNATSTLTVELAAVPSVIESPPAPAPTVPEVMRLEARTVVPPLPVPDPTLPPPRPATPPPVPQIPDAQPASTPPALQTARIRMATNYSALSSLPEELVQRSQGEFLVEVDKLVQVVRSPDVVYPADALAAGREDTVVVWLALDRDGAITESIIVSGAPEFAEAVTSALPSARFLPAVNAGENVPFYLIMTFDFRGG